MAVKIRLTRLGKKKQPTYRVVVMDARKQRDGEYIEQLGFYDPRPNPSVVEIDNERALHWLTTGAQPTDRARKLLEISGAWTQFKVARGEIHTVGGDAPVADAAATDKGTKGKATKGKGTKPDTQPVATGAEPESEVVEAVEVDEVVVTDAVVADEAVAEDAVEPAASDETVGADENGDAT
jgi:small subunit ribosomal protein S16